MDARPAAGIGLDEPLSPRSNHTLDNSGDTATGTLKKLVFAGIKTAPIVLDDKIEPIVVFLETDIYTVRRRVFYHIVDGFLQNAKNRNFQRNRHLAFQDRNFFL